MTNRVEPIDILLVEDSEGDARLINEMLKEGNLIDYAVTDAADMLSAKSYLDARKFSVIILDLNLPDSIGLATLEQIIEKTGGIIPVIVLAGLSDEDAAITAIERGAEDYLVKGDVNSAQIFRSIRYAIERKKIALKLKESEGRYETFINATDDIAFLKDDQFRYIISNIKNAAFLGKKPGEDIIGLTDFDLMDSETASGCRESDILALSSNSYSNKRRDKRRQNL